MFRHHSNLILFATFFIYFITLVNSVEVIRKIIIRKKIIHHKKPQHTNLCPQSQYVSRLEFTNLGDNDFNVSVECQSFSPAGSANTVSMRERCDFV